jgi:2'-5' RNA ligase
MSDPKESALVILVPEVEALVRQYRDRLGPSETERLPAHITVLYPFVSPDEIGPVVTTALCELFARFPPVTFSLVRVQTWPGVLYLAPTPADPFVTLTQAVAEQYPEHPPYSGTVTDIIPHLTVAQIADHEQLARVAVELEAVLRSRPPIEVTASEVALMDNALGQWQVRTVFRLGDG